jgi:ParB family transcriptional regulator, chromosome partitioning protein
LTLIKRECRAAMAAKNEFSQGLLASIRSSSRVGEGGRPLDLPLEHIAPDPNQPRKAFEGIEELAETIRRYGVLQPITVRKAPTPGRWILVLGERRLRAAKMAGLETIPAYEAPAGPGEEDHRLAAQVIENQHRSDLTNSELARVVTRLTQEKVKNSDVAIIVGVPEHQLKLYRAIQKLPAALGVWVDKLDVRTVYELHLAWEKTGEEGRGVIQSRLAAIEARGDGLSLTDARRLIATATLSVPTVQTQPADGVGFVDPERTSGRPELVAGGVDVGRQEPVPPAAPGLSDRRRTADAGRLATLVGQLADALLEAATALESTDRRQANKLRRKAQEAKDEIDGRAQRAEGGVRAAE